MVNVGMCQQHIIEFSRRNWYFLILIVVASLLHTTVYQHLLPAGFQIVAASGHFMIRSNKH